MNLEDILLRGTRAAQPSASIVTEGSLYYVTDEAVVEQSRASAWVSYSGSGASPAITQLTGDVTAGPGSGSQVATIPNNTIVTAKILNGAVTYAKMQDVSAISKLLGRGAAAGAGDPEEITLGTNLSMSGTTLNAAGGGGSSGLVLVAEKTGAGSHLTFLNTEITSTYDAYLFQFQAVVPSVDDSQIAMQVSTDNGANWQTGTTYPYALRYLQADGTTATLVGLNGYPALGDASKIGLYIGGPKVSRFYGCSGELRMFNPTLATRPTTFTHKFAFFNQDGLWTTLEGGGAYSTANAINAARFYFDGGSTITAGTIRLYGYAK